MIDEGNDMDDGPSLDDILSSEPIESPAEPPAPEQSGPPRDEHGRFAPASDPGDENPEPAETPAEEAAPPAAQQDAEQGHIPVAALRDERQKRQAAEERLQRLEQYFAKSQQPAQQQQPQEVPDMFADPAGYTQWIAGQVRDHVMQEVQQYGDNFGVQQRAQVSEMLVRPQHEDYDQVISGPLTEAVRDNPFLAQRIAAAPNPALEGYRIGKQFAAAKEYGSDLPPSRAVIEAEIRQQIMDELGLSNAPKAPTSLASSRSASMPRSGPAWAGPEPLEDILG